jgi:simple sugar transport system ATP-binding protein
MPPREWVARLRIRAAGVEGPVHQLSGGNQRRVALAKWLATDPQALILDSPTVGVDVGNKEGIYEIIRELAARGIGILLISDGFGSLHGLRPHPSHARRTGCRRVQGHRDQRDDLGERVYA